MVKRLEQVAALVVAAGLAIVSYWLFFSWMGADRRPRAIGIAGRQASGGGVRRIAQYPGPLSSTSRVSRPAGSVSCSRTPLGSASCAAGAAPDAGAAGP